MRKIINVITVSALKDILHLYNKEEISFSRFAEMLNEIATTKIHESQKEILRGYYIKANRVDISKEDIMQSIEKDLRELA